MDKKKLTRSEAGKLGAEASRPRCVALRKARETAYYTNPRKCLVCEKVLTYGTNKKAKFCSRKCAAKLNGHLFPKNPSKRNRCEVCGVLHGLATNFCRKHELEQRIIAGLVGWRGTLKRYLISVRGRSCEKCGLLLWNGEPIPLELDHIDGNPSVHLLSNLRLLCPNCHAQTPTAKGKNKGRGRGTLGLRN